MKKFFLVILLFTLGTSLAFAQPSRPKLSEEAAASAIQKRNWLVGTSIGDLSYNFDTETFTFGIFPRAGYFVSDNAVLGSEAQLSLVAFDGGEIFTYGITPFARYYFPEGARATGRFFGEAVFGIAGSSIEDSDEDAIVSTVWGLRGGYAHFISNTVAIEGTLGYVNTTADIDVGNSESGLSIALGFNLYLQSKANMGEE